ncbi:UvrB/UvrC motif-containing protein [Anaerobaca lacustris]|jgi:protein arginine kinase activator|uniref:UvrB/UvrC motif-containing protein n=1 Tax=Anaerobaca lacustris TaxID=3044600 RepID=A0AAW6TY94_9BACT|nr:UvrB/UvrC motif-containing protein [Sedimentisphaerales bacterium M17dextr]
MQCQICNKRTATIHLTEISEGVRNEMHICEQCAAEQGIAAQSQMSINELLSNLLASQPSDEELLGGADEVSACPNCGFTLDRLRKDGTLGCPHDYEVFQHSLLPLIQHAHNGRSTHCGKVPSKVPCETKKLVELSSLRQELEQAVRDEDYERAAELRDRMKQQE